jgi:hypothetical protein
MKAIPSDCVVAWWNKEFIGVMAIVHFLSWSSGHCRGLWIEATGRYRRLFPKAENRATAVTQ